MVQAGGLEPPTSGSTDQRSNQLSYACTTGFVGMLDPSGRNLGASRRFGKRPGIFFVPNENPGISARVSHPLSQSGDAWCQAALLTALMLALVGSAVSVAPFCACSDISFAGATNASKCLRR